jgi:transcriptional regulator with XRE-family HTH domain
LQKRTGYMRPVKKNIVGKFRRWKNLKQKDIANYLYISIGTYRQLESNDRKLKLNEQAKLAELFGVSESQLYEEEDK